MRILRTHLLRFGLLVGLVVIVCLSPMTALPLTVDGGCAGTGATTVELSYDDGVFVDWVSKVCDSCGNFQGVRFSMPAGLVRATIASVRFYSKPARPGAEVYLYVKGADRVTDLIPRILYKIGGTGWHTVNLTGAEATGDFWVLVQRPGESPTTLGSDYWNDNGRSFTGEHPTTLQAWKTGDIMIRATIIQEIHVGQDQPYRTIQSAVDAAAPGLTIIVHPGTYDEDVTVNKRLTIRSLEGPGKTTVQTSLGGKNTISVTASGVSLSGFTIRHVTDIYSAGVSLENVSCSRVSGNVIRDNSYGVYVSEGSTNNIIVGNECISNINGIYMEGSQNYISGNKIHGNTAPVGSAVFLSDIASGNQLRFNSVTIDDGAEANVIASQQVFNENSAEDVSATENWWGSIDGPWAASGQFAMVGDKVLYDPWLRVAPLGVQTEAPPGADFTVDAKDEASVTVVEEGPGTPVVTVANFGENPQGKFSAKSMGKWVDVLFTNVDGVDLAEIRVHYTDADLGSLKERSLRLYWWNGEKWKACSKSGMDKGYKYVWAKVDFKTKPGLNDLQGTFFAIGKNQGGMSWWVILLAILLVLILLVALRLFWVLVVKSERAV